MTTRERFRLKRALSKQIKAEKESLRDFFASPSITSPYTTADIERIVFKRTEEFNTWMK